MISHEPIVALSSAPEDPLDSQGHSCGEWRGKSHSSRLDVSALRRSLLTLGLVLACVFLASSIAFPNTAPVADARPLRSCTVQAIYHPAVPCHDEYRCPVQNVCYGCGCWKEQCGTWCDMDGCYRDCYSYYEDRTCTSEVVCDWYCVGGSDAWIEYVEQCIPDNSCTGTCPLGGNLRCQGSGTTCGSGVNCWCEGSGRSECSSSAQCSGPVECPYSQQAGSYWSCQAGQCVSVCNPNGNPPGDNGNGGNTPPIVPTVTRTPIPSPTPIPQPHCPSNAEDLGGSVTSTVPPTGPVITLSTAPKFPIVAGQDPTKRGLDLTADISVPSCTVNWHYRVQEDYIYCGKETCNCSIDNCELRQRWKEWDDTCSENYPLAGVTIDGRLNADSVNWINGPLQQQYPGVRVYQGSLRFFPNVLARQTEYTVGNPTTWSMAGLKYLLQDPGDWDVVVNVATQPTTHCGPQQWTQTFPKYLPVYFRDQTITK